MPEKPSSKKARLDNGNRHCQPANRRSSPREGPISKLTNDVLFFIFTINSHMEMLPLNKECMCSTLSEMYYEDDTLTTNRYSSQVCRRWRDIILSSPTIWANSLNIEELNQRQDEWRLEVLERVGKAPISLVGRIGFEKGKYATLFVLVILEHAWHRIRYLSLCASSIEIEEQMLLSLREPAPCLEYFLYIRGQSTYQEPDSLRLEDGVGVPLFSNMSPKLTHICCGGWTFDFIPGLANLRCLWLAGHTASFTILDIYVALQHLPLLEELFINHDHLLESEFRLGDRTPRLTLPRLADIAINNPATTLITDLVRHILPARGCRLVVSDCNKSLGEPLDELIDADLANLSQVYSTFIKDITDFQSVKYLLLSYTQNDGFAFRAGNGSRFVRGYDLASNYSYLKFSYSANSWQDPAVLNTFSVPIMNALASRTDLGTIAKLDLTLDKNAIAYSQVEVLKILRQLKSVSELTTDLPTLRILTKMQAASDFSLLPCITTVTVTCTSHLSKVAIMGSPPECLGIFLKGHLEQGIPVRKLRLSRSDDNDNKRWGFLHGIDGLSVFWRGIYDEREDEEEKVNFLLE